MREGDSAWLVRAARYQGTKVPKGFGSELGHLIGRLNQSATWRDWWMAGPFDRLELWENYLDHREFEAVRVPIRFRRSEGFVSGTVNVSFGSPAKAWTVESARRYAHEVLGEVMETAGARLKLGRPPALPEPATLGQQAPTLPKPRGERGARAAGGREARAPKPKLSDLVAITTVGEEAIQWECKLCGERSKPYKVSIAIVRWWGRHIRAEHPEFGWSDSCS